MMQAGGFQIFPTWAEGNGTRFTYAGRGEAIPTTRWSEDGGVPNEMLAMVGHEIRNCLSGVLGFADLMMEERLTPAQAEYVEMIQRSGEMLSGLCEDLMDVTRMQAGRLNLKLAPCDLRDLLDEVTSIHRWQAETKGLNFSVYVERGVPEKVRADARRLKQVLGNVLGNAVKFTAQGNIRLTAALTSGRYAVPGKVWVEFRVQDTGIGIAEDRKGEIFQPYVRGHETTDCPALGAGLGLAICQLLTQLMDGVLDYKSTPGRGSAFYLQYPLEVL